MLKRTKCMIHSASHRLGLLYLSICCQVGHHHCQWTSWILSALFPALYFFQRIRVSYLWWLWWRLCFLLSNHTGCEYKELRCQLQLTVLCYPHSAQGIHTYSIWKPESLIVSSQEFKDPQWVVDCRREWGCHCFSTLVSTHASCSFWRHDAV